ncbi:hypothetical protein [Microbulbifer sp. TB1203]|uniref:hypothetical protein n=1 Tax=Microbulbifer sp. TB1203 TaxID=3021712 RepID=UPI0027E57664|nr:hypothetical protein [Microbulbifer sp. TB1203]
MILLNQLLFAPDELNQVYIVFTQRQAQVKHALFADANVLLLCGLARGLRLECRYLRLG